MEAAFFAIDIIGVVLLLYWSIRNDELGPDAPSVGLFAYRGTTGGRTGYPRKMGRGKNFRLVRKLPPSRQGFRQPRQNRPSLSPAGVHSPDAKKAMFKPINFSDGLLTVGGNGAFVDGAAL